MAEVYNKGKLDILQQEFKQWGYIGLTGNSWEGEIGPYNFPVAFNNQCFLVLPSLCNNDNTNPISYDSTVQQRKWNTKQFWLYQQSMGGKPWFGYAHYISIGNQIPINKYLQLDGLGVLY